MKQIDEINKLVHIKFYDNFRWIKNYDQLAPTTAKMLFWYMFFILSSFFPYKSIGQCGSYVAIVMFSYLLVPALKVGYLRSTYKTRIYKEQNDIYNKVQILNWMLEKGYGRETIPLLLNLFPTPKKFEFMTFAKNTWTLLNYVGGTTIILVFYKIIQNFVKVFIRLGKVKKLPNLEIIAYIVAVLLIFILFILIIIFCIVSHHRLKKEYKKEEYIWRLFKEIQISMSKDSYSDNFKVKAEDKQKQLFRYLLKEYNKDFENIKTSMPKVKKRDFFKSKFVHSVVKKLSTKKDKEKEKIALDKMNNISKEFTSLIISTFRIINLDNIYHRK